MSRPSPAWFPRPERKPLIYVMILVVLAAGCFASMLAAFGKARSEAVEQLYAQERILATQAAVGLSDYFDFYERSLRFLASLDSVGSMTEAGKDILRNFYKTHAPGIASVSRVDEKGFLGFTYPFEGNASVSLAGQAHVARFLATKRLTLSGVFKSVQGFPAIALYVPVYRGEVFEGGLAILIPFKEISSRFLSKISIGRSGYALLLDMNGTELFAPARGGGGQGQGVTRSMMAGMEGRASYSRNAEGGELPSAWKGYFLPVRIGEVSWSILVTALESEAVSAIVGFRDFWLLSLLLLAATFCLWTLLSAAALKRIGAANESLTLVNGDLERAISDARNAQAQLIASEKMAALGQVAASIAHQFATPLGAMSSSNENILAVLSEDIARDIKGFARLSAGSRETFLALLEKGARRASETAGSISCGEAARAGREMKAAARAALESMGASDPASIADDLSDLGALGDARSLAALLAEEGGREMIGAARRLSSALGSALLIKRSAEKAAAVITALRTYVRGDRSVEAVEIDLAAEIDLLLGLYVEGAHPAVAIERHYFQGTRVMGNSDRLAQVWVNVINNAIQAMEGRGRLELRIEEEGDEAVVTIADDGPGIPDAIKARIFEPFFTTKPPGTGSGLGLDIARSILTEHGGSLSFTSEAGRTAFVARLPVLRTALSDPQSATQLA